MESIEIDNVEVTDNIIGITYWTSGYYGSQKIWVSTDDFENWLLGQRKVSLDAYWDYWDANGKLEQTSQIIYSDLKQYMLFRFGMVKAASAKSGWSFSDKKPMTKVSKSRARKPGSKSA